MAFVLACPDGIKTRERLGITGSQGGAKLEIWVISAGLVLSASYQKTELKWCGAIAENPLWAWKQQSPHMRALLSN
jgi:hypothetical protein